MNQGVNILDSWYSQDPECFCTLKIRRLVEFSRSLLFL
uniref:Uncharacterized protein n=1 Tax=Anguilla anguilla TaxID=7936 RepID=A0A0E9T5G1_ANGAN